MTVDITFTPIIINFFFELWLNHQILHNFVSQLVTWRVVTGEEIYVDHVGTHLHRSQFAT